MYIDIMVFLGSNFENKPEGYQVPDRFASAASTALLRQYGL